MCVCKRLHCEVCGNQIDASKVLIEQIEALQKELEAQARIVGMGAERELKLKAELERKRERVARLRSGLESIASIDISQWAPLTVPVNMARRTLLADAGDEGKEGV